MDSHEEIICGACGRIYKVINNVPSFVSSEFEGFTEVALHDRDKFLEMKRVAYSSGGFISRLYNHYHSYTAKKRSENGSKGITVDVGFGIGEHYPFISAGEVAEGSFIGVDLDRFKLEHFSAQHPEITVLQASAFCLPFANSCVDVVQLLAILEHLTPEDITRVIDEALRILKPAGVLIICYPAEGGVLLLLSQWFMHAFLKARTGFDLDKGVVHRHLTGAEELRSILGRNKGIERLESSFYPFGFSSANTSLFINELYRKR